MRLETLTIGHLRNLGEVELALSGGLNLFEGSNGAGKTSVVEAVHLLAHGRSFRSHQVDSLIQRGRDSFSIHAKAVDPEGRSIRLGMARSHGEWQLRANGAGVDTLTEFVRHLAAVTLEPESHGLVTGPAEYRRRFLDWLLFHVEPDFVPVWRRYLRALKQRNAALRLGTISDDSLSAWEREMAVSGQRLHGFRTSLLSSFEVRLLELAQALVPAAAPLAVQYRAGWSPESGLAEVLREGRGSDRERGFSQRGPHRADWRLAFPDGLAQTQLSRGQAKLVAMACLLAQGALYRELLGGWPVFLCDDLASELDPDHQRRVLGWLVETGAQILVTGTEVRAEWADWMVTRTGRFHVEQGRVDGGLL